ncbi:unnamed protein product [Schistocephalus solidus]|uniref:superoxide dismutase n=1 Tax=Schistocephalus solidus TaxID=70667 RepID=A0A183TFF8_SCHSO|nr:unnamed protein product [Schistocephalus solidus]
MSVSRVETLTAPSYHILPDLTYDFYPLEPTIRTDIMRVHYEKHHATYPEQCKCRREATVVKQTSEWGLVRLMPGVKTTLNHHLCESRSIRRNNRAENPVWHRRMRACLLLSVQ